MRGIGDDTSVLELFDSVACYAPLEPAALR
jgi:hypothetical protein